MSGTANTELGEVDRHTEQHEAATREAFLSERDVARRWRKSVRSLQRWRADGSGPSYFVIGSSIRYRLADVLAFEAAARRNGTAQP